MTSKLTDPLKMHRPKTQQATDCDHSKAGPFVSTIYCSYFKIGSSDDVFQIAHDRPIFSNSPEREAFVRHVRRFFFREAAKRQTQSTSVRPVKINPNSTKTRTKVNGPVINTHAFNTNGCGPVPLIRPLAARPSRSSSAQYRLSGSCIARVAARCDPGKLLRVSHRSTPEGPVRPKPPAGLPKSGKSPSPVWCGFENTVG